MKTRQTDRKDVHYRSRYRYGAGLALQITVVDVTPEGCGLRDVPITMGTGDRISLKFEGVGTFEAEVRWVRRGGAGAQFERAMNPATFARLKACIADDGTSPATMQSCQPVGGSRRIV